MNSTRPGAATLPMLGAATLPMLGAAVVEALLKSLPQAIGA
jgi:hypothetical protein